MTIKPNPEQTKAKIHAIIDRLAGLETACPALPYGDEDFMHNDCGCHGTGQVARHPWARRVCLHMTANACAQVSCPEWLPNYDVRESKVWASLTQRQAYRVLEKMRRLWDGDTRPSEDEVHLAFWQAVEEVVLISARCVEEGE